MPTARNILVHLPNWVGDVVMATPTLRALRAGFPDAQIACLGRPAALATLESTPFCDAMLPDESSRRPRAWFFPKTVRRLRAFGADTVLLFPNSFRSALLARFCGARRRIGYSRDGRGWLLTDGLAPKRDARGRFVPMPMIETYAQLLAPLGLSIQSRAMELPIRDADRAKADAMLQEARGSRSGPWVLLNPGGAFGPSKFWPAERYAALADAMIERLDARIIINAAPNATERAIASTVAEAMKTKPAVNLAERDNSLGLLKALCARCDLVVTNDTGARHIAVAAGASVVTIFGSTDPDWTTLDAPRERIVRADVPCGPCQKKQCPLPTGQEHLRCLRDVSVDMVLTACESLLETSGSHDS